MWWITDWVGDYLERKKTTQIFHTRGRKYTLPICTMYIKGTISPRSTGHGIGVLVLDLSQWLEYWATRLGFGSHFGNPTGVLSTFCHVYLLFYHVAYMYFIFFSNCFLPLCVCDCFCPVKWNEMKWMLNVCSDRDDIVSFGTHDASSFRHRFWAISVTLFPRPQVPQPPCREP